MLKIMNVEKKKNNQEIVSLSDGNKLIVDEFDGRIRWMLDYSKLDDYITRGELMVEGDHVYFV